MTDDKTDRRDSSAVKIGAMKRSGEDKGTEFNSWLNDELHALYDPILEEPIPDDLRQIVDRLKEKKK